MHLPSDACCGGRRRGDSAQADSTRQAPGLECFPLCFAQVLSVSWFCFLSFPDGVLSPSSESPDLGMVWGPCCRSVLLPLASVHLGICRGSPTSLSLRLHLPVVVWKQPLRGLCLDLIDTVSQGGDSDVSSRRVLCAWVLVSLFCEGSTHVL